LGQYAINVLFMIKFIMGRSTVHYTDNITNNILKRLHNKLRPAGTPVQRVEYIIELLLLRIFEIKLRHENEFKPLRKLFEGDNYKLLFSYLQNLTGEQIKTHLNSTIFPFYGRILQEAKKVFTHENLPQKVQDQLVLIEEVFTNSSFTTNVQSGNMHEIIGLVAEIDESTILRTDVLGDAIESALSETGGTQDIGLYRTPDHIRQMMVALADPTFEDTIYDPACGTGGFLFDAFRYVLEKVTKDGKWPSLKCPPSHPELNEYFKKYFQQFDEPMPDIDTANKFYREGVGGTEYLGMIRKMAAINLYIRGLNPANIRQGDSLALFDPALHSESKTCILSNPPFGAERDQPAYPNVWKDFAKESETTILFVKLMLDMLKEGGRGVVVVSEGFLTWDKASARTLRKKLLEEANLRAIISLPQGVFVSKLGQGVKTSILYFEKGEPTKWVWYYKIENDGFSMGVNRKPIPGSQLPEVIELFTKYVKKGKIPPETKYSFVIPAEWIKTLDPRLKERIKKETREKIILREKPRLEKKIKQLKEKLQKGKITKLQFEQKKKQLELTLENRIQNRIAKELEKAHQYSFNLRTYRSDLDEERIKKLQRTINKIFQQVKESLETPNRQAVKSLSKNLQMISKPLSEYQRQINKRTKTIEQIYEKINKSAEPIREFVRNLPAFNFKSAINVEIFREIVEKYKEQEKLLNEIYKVLKKRSKYPFTPLGQHLTLITEKIKPNNKPETEFVILGVSNKEGVFVNKRKLGKEIKQAYYIVKKNHFCYNPYRINVGSIGLNEFDYKNQIISGAYVVFKVDERVINPRYLYALFKTKRFLDYVREMATGGVRMNFKFEYLQNWKIPLPPLDVQKQIIEKIERQKSIIQGVEKILEGWEVDENLFKNHPKRIFGEVITLVRRPIKVDPTKEYIQIRLQLWGRGPIKRESAVKQEIRTLNQYIVKEGDFIVSKIDARNGAMGIVPKELDGAIVTNDFPTFTVNESYVLRDYLKYLVKTSLLLDELNELSEGATGRKRVSISDILNLKIPLPPLDVQQKIVEELDKEMEALEKVRMLKEKAEKRIEQILEEVWGGEEEDKN